MIRIDLFCEDSFHEIFVGSLVRRMARERERAVDLRIRSATGGTARMQSSLNGYLLDLTRGSNPLPDAVIVVVDANCKGHNRRKGEMVGAASSKLSGREAPLGGREFAEEIVEKMDMNTASKEPSFRRFVRELKGILGQLPGA